MRLRGGTGFRERVPFCLPAGQCLRQGVENLLPTPTHTSPSDLWPQAGAYRGTGEEGKRTFGKMIPLSKPATMSPIARAGETMEEASLPQGVTPTWSSRGRGDSM